MPPICSFALKNKMRFMKHHSKSKSRMIFYMPVLALLLILASCGGKGEQETHDQITNKIGNDIPSIKNTPPEKPDTTTQLSENKKGIPNEILHLTDNDFDEKIQNGIVIVDFWATWCGPCRMQAPILENVNAEMAGKVTIAKLDIDRNRITTNRFGVMNIPTLILFKNGKQVNTFVGLTQKEDIISALNKEL